MSTSHSVVIRATPILPVTDMEPAIAFYERLGFEVTSYDAGYAWASFGGREVLHLRHVPGLDIGANATSCYLHVTDPDAAHAAWAAAGIDVGPVEDTEWGMREFAIMDPSLNRVRVGHPG